MKALVWLWNWPLLLFLCSYNGQRMGAGESIIDFIKVCLLCFSTSERMLALAFSWLKMIKKHSKMIKKTFFFVFLHKPLMCILCTWWNRYFFHHFPMFFIVFDHAFAGWNTQHWFFGVRFLNYDRFNTPKDAKICLNIFSAHSVLSILR